MKINSLKSLEFAGIMMTSKARYTVRSKKNKDIDEDFVSLDDAFERASEIYEKTGHAVVNDMHKYEIVWEKENKKKTEGKETIPAFEKIRKKIEWCVKNKKPPKIKTIRWWLKNEKNPDNLYLNCVEIERDIENWYKKWPNGCFAKIFHDEKKFKEQTNIAREEALKILEKHL